MTGSLRAEAHGEGRRPAAGVRRADVHGVRPAVDEQAAGHDHVEGERSARAADAFTVWVPLVALAPASLLPFRSRSFPIEPTRVTLSTSFIASFVVKLPSTSSVRPCRTPLSILAFACLSDGLARVGVGAGGGGFDEPPPTPIVSVAVLSLGSDSRSEVTVAVSSCAPLPLTFVENLTSVEVPFEM